MERCESGGISGDIANGSIATVEAWSPFRWVTTLRTNMSTTSPSPR